MGKSREGEEHSSCLVPISNLMHPQNLEWYLLLLAVLSTPPGHLWLIFQRVIVFILRYEKV